VRLKIFCQLSLLWKPRKRINRRKKSKQ